MEEGHKRRHEDKVTKAEDERKRGKASIFPLCVCLCVNQMTVDQITKTVTRVSYIVPLDGSLVYQQSLLTLF